MTTVGGLIEATRRLLLGSHRPELNLLTNNISASTTSLQFTLPLVGLNTGSYVAIGDEIMFVTSVNTGGKTAEVIRGMLGTTAVAVTVGTPPPIVEINPLFPRFFIKQSLKDEIASWPEDMFSVDQVTISGEAGARAFDLDVLPDHYSILDVQRAPLSTDIENADRRVAFAVQRIAVEDRFPSGQALILRGPLDTASDLLVTVALPYDLENFDDTIDLEEDIGLHTQAHDIPPIGAAWRLTIGREMRRNFGEGQQEPRRAEEVPASANLRVTEALLEQRNLRLSHERARLRGRWPWRSG